MDAAVKTPEVDQKPNGLRFEQPSFVSITDSALFMDGDPLKKFDELSAGLQKLDRARDVVIAASQEVRWAAMASATSAVADAGYDSVVFAFRPRQRLPKPKSVLLPKAVASADIPETQGEFRGDEVFAQCPDATHAIRKTIDPSASIAPKQVVEQFAKVLPSALRSCRCRVNMEDVRALLWKRLRGGAEAVYTVRVLLAKPTDAKATELANSPDATWAAAHQKVLALEGSTDRYRLEAR